jgi:hypothetical protein
MAFCVTALVRGRVSRDCMLRLSLCAAAAVVPAAA